MSINEKYVPTEKQLVEQYADMLVALNHVDAEECRAMVRETFRRAKAEALQEAAWEWEKLVQREKPPVRGALWMLKRAEEIEAVS